MKKDLTKTVQEDANELLKLMGSTATASVLEDSENDALLVNIEAKDEAGLLIGRHGDTLNSLQMVLGLMLRQKLGEWKRIFRVHHSVCFRWFFNPYF